MGRSRRPTAALRNSLTRRRETRWPPRDVWTPWSNDISADTLIGAAGLPTGQKFFSGDLSGESHLTGLPRAPKGTATINLINGMIGGQTAEMADGQPDV